MKNKSVGMAVRAVYYARVSTEEEKQVNALAKQVQECEDTIKTKGWKLINGYVDEGKSGTQIKGRNEYKRLLVDLEKDVFDVIVIKSQDRLMRSTKDWYIFVDKLVKNGKRLYLYLEGKFFVPGDDALITGIKAILAEEYSRDLSKKLTNSNKRRMQKAAEGKEFSVMGTGKQFGLNIVNGKYVIDWEQAEVVKIVFEKYLELDSVRKTRDYVNEMGFRNSSGKPFTDESISRILKNAHYKGTYILGRYRHDFDTKTVIKTDPSEWVVVENNHEAIVSAEVFDEVQRRLKAKTGNGRGKKIGRDRFSNKLFCPHCGAVMWKHSSNGYSNWYCSNNYGRGAVACEEGFHVTTVAVEKALKTVTDLIEINREAVKKDIIDWLEHLKLRLSGENDNAEVEMELEKYRKQKERVKNLYIEGIIEADEMKEKAGAIDKRVIELQKRLVPTEENEDIKDVERILKNIDSEIDEYIKTMASDNGKLDFILEHTERITPVTKKHFIVELDLVAGAIIVGENFMLFAMEYLPFPHGRVCFYRYGEKERTVKAVLCGIRGDQHGGDRKPAASGNRQKMPRNGCPGAASQGKANDANGLRKV